MFGHQMRFNLEDGFPLVTTKKVWFRALAVEMLWFLSGSSNIRPLVDQGITIWTDWCLSKYLEAENLPVPKSPSIEWEQAKRKFEDRMRQDPELAEKYGDLGPVYGYQWRHFGARSSNGRNGLGFDQIEDVVKSLRENPYSRRHIVSAWDPRSLADMALPPCHLLFQFWVHDRKLSCQLYIRSNDLFLGAPFNIAQYALLTHIMAQQAGLGVCELVYTIGDAHIYLNHLDQVKAQLERSPLPRPRLRIGRHPESICGYRFEDFILEDYEYHPAIKAPVAV